MEHSLEFIVAVKYATYLTGHNQQTNNHELDQIGKQLFNTKWNGVYSQDEAVRQANKLKPYMIFNVDKSDQNGSHWISMIYDKQLQKYLIFDSFGRPTKKLLKYLAQVKK